MRTIKTENLEAAVKNVAVYGDTDVAPYPLENHWFFDRPADVVAQLEKIDERFDEMMGSYPVIFVRNLSGVGYAGFRATTQIDPIWNAYLLALVLEIGGDIEAARISPAQDTLFAYRFAPDPTKGSLFARAPSWKEYQQVALSRAKTAEYVLATDISDFYGRVYHHRLENALQQATKKKEVVRRLKVLLFRLSSETSYGLPIGGNAARLLAELLLNRSDRLLVAHGVKFIRFVDDYYIFASSRLRVMRRRQRLLALVSFSS